MKHLATLVFGIVMAGLTSPVSAQTYCPEGLSISDAALPLVDAINFGGSDHTASDGTIYRASDPAVIVRGRAWGKEVGTMRFDNTQDDPLFRTRLSGNIVETRFETGNGCFRVTLLLTEPTASITNRNFSVAAEGRTFISAFNPLEATGSNRFATTKSFDVKVTDGVLNLIGQRLGDSAPVHWSAIRIHRVTPASAAAWTPQRRDFSGIWLSGGDTTPQEVRAANAIPGHPPGYQDFHAGTGYLIRWSDFVAGYDEASNAFTYDRDLLRRVLESYFDEDRSTAKPVPGSVGRHAYLRVWTGSNAPAQIYDGTAVSSVVLTDQGVSRMRETSPGSGLYAWPDYRDPDYRRHFAEFMQELADAIDGLPNGLKDRVSFVQVGIGATGDEQLFKGNLQSGYTFSDEDYLDFAKFASLTIQNAFEGTVDHILWNAKIEAPNDAEAEFARWLYARADVRLEKFTGLAGIARSYDSPGATSFIVPRHYQLESDGLPRYVRKEFPYAQYFSGQASRNSDVEEAIYSRMKANPDYSFREAEHMYWTALMSVHQGLDGWQFDGMNLAYWAKTTGPQTGLEPTRETWDRGYFPFDEFHEFAGRHAGYKDPLTSPFAFIALRDALDAEDTLRFDPNIFGASSHSRSDHCEPASPAQLIVARFEDYGASIDDCDAMGFKLVGYLRRLDGYNDVAHEIPAGNLRRYIYQIGVDAPAATSLAYDIHTHDTPEGIDTRLYQGGYWRVGDFTPSVPNDYPIDPGATSEEQKRNWRPYGRYARGFDNKPTNPEPVNSMEFGFHPSFNPANLSIRLRVTWFDDVSGAQWKLRYRNARGEFADAGLVTGSGNNVWRTQTYLIEDGGFDLDPVDFLIQNQAPLADTRFHMIEADILR